MRALPLGSVTVNGAVGGLVFVLVNAGSVPGAVVWRIDGALAFAAVVWCIARSPQHTPAPPSREALRTYGLSVVAMLVALPVGAGIIGNVLDKPDAVLVWVVFVVGAHFLPFARAFHLPVFLWLSLSLVIVSLVGAVPALALGSETAASWTAVAAGFVLLGFSGIGPRLSQPAQTRPG